jgi:hypothetical protein
LGLLLIRRILLRRFSDGVVGVTLLLLGAGTNLLNYASADGLFTHIYTFTLCAGLIELSHHWWANGKWRHAIYIAAVLGLMVLIRNLNVIFVLIPLLYGTTGLQSLRARVLEIWSRRQQVAAMLGVFVVVLIPQLVVWHIATDSWVVYSYGNQHFNFTHPQLWDTFFSFEPHGFLPWSPVMLLAFPGLILARQALKGALFTTVTTFALFAYLIASWYSWWLGGGYGQRGFIDIYPLLAFGLAGFVQFLAARGKLIRWSAGVLLTAVCYAVLVQMNHYWHLDADKSDPLTWGGATPAQYWDGVLHPTK